MILSPDLRDTLLILGLVLTIATIYFSGTYKGTSSYMERGRVGEIEDVEVMIVTDVAAGGALVRLAFWPTEPVRANYGLIKASEARTLAQLLRLAAAPGRTLEEARFNVRHGGHSSVESK